MSENDDSNDEGLRRERNLTTVIYALQASAFVLGITYFAAAALNYLKMKAVKDTWLESHFRWQLKTFWYSLLWGVLGGLLLRWVVGYMILGATVIWVIFRITVGWVRLSENKPIYKWG